MGNFRVLRRLFPPVGTARVFLNDEQVATVANSSRYRFDGLESDQHYVYRIEVDGRVSGGSVRTYAAEPDTLTFLVIGDFGTGESAQFDLGEAMAQTIRAKQNTDDPVRFVLTVGDNIYRDKGGPFWWKDLSCEVIKKCRGTGDDDNDWKDKFVLPYKDLLSSVPFYPTLGNHDENQSEERGDLEVYVDNFMLGDRLPSPSPDNSRRGRFQ